MNLYRENILDHYKRPRNFGHLDKPDVTFEEYNVSCGDKIIIELKLGAPFEKTQGKQGSEPGSRIDDIRFSGEGCAISMASASMLTEKVKGMDVSTIMKLSTADILSLIGTTLTPTRVKCAMLPLEVLHQALAQRRLLKL